MTRLFDAYAMVDWSAANTPTRGKDSIWVAFGGAHAPSDKLINVSTRFATMELLRDYSDKIAADGKRALIGFDFAFGYPQGASERMCGKADWASIWALMAQEFTDTPKNENNRFQVADTLNRTCFEDVPNGPFWGHPHGDHFESLKPKKPDYENVKEHRVVEQRATSAKSVWQMCYTGAVGGQTVAGIASLEALRKSRPNLFAIWPFETGFAASQDRPVTICEIYPSLVPFKERVGEVKDAAQVRSMIEHVMALDANASLQNWLGEPEGLSRSQRAIVLKEEGWIAGVGTKAVKHSVSADTDYIKDPAEIYRQSFATVEREAQLDKLPANMRPVATRLVHSCGMIDILDDLEFSSNAVQAGQKALAEGKSIFTDVEMVKAGIIEKFLPASNKLLCTLNDVRVPDHAKEIGNTRSAAAVDFWKGLEGAIVVIGNAPTALFRLLERVEEGGPKPMLVIGIPVGFIGAAESKQALSANSSGLEFITVHGRRGGSAMASSVLNAIAGGLG